jgi:hypothetical protein
LYQGTTSVLPPSSSLLIFRTDFSPCGVLKTDFFRKPLPWCSRRPLSTSALAAEVKMR